MNAASYVAEAGCGKFVGQKSRVMGSLKLSAQDSLDFARGSLSPRWASKKQVPPLRIAIDEANRNAAVGMTDVFGERGASERPTLFFLSYSVAPALAMKLA